MASKLDVNGKLALGNIVAAILTIAATEDTVGQGMLLLFVYMTMSSIASGGLNGFTVTALVELYGADLVTANAALTALLAASAVGVLAGGVLADRTRRHDLIISAGFLVAGLLAAQPDRGYRPPDLHGRLCSG